MVIVFAIIRICNCFYNNKKTTFRICLLAKENWNLFHSEAVRNSERKLHMRDKDDTRRNGQNCATRSVRGSKANQTNSHRFTTASIRRCVRISNSSRTKFPNISYIIMFWKKFSINLVCVHMDRWRDYLFQRILY